MLAEWISPLGPARFHQLTPGWTVAEYRAGEVRLFLGSKGAIPADPRDKPLHVMLRHLLSLHDGTDPRDRRFVRSGGGQLLIEHAGTAALTRFSLSATDAVVAVALADSGRIGVDVETLARVSLNASPHDGWLSPDERADLAGLSGARLVAELACRWMLKEAIGKAAGVGLAMPLAHLTIRASTAGPVVVATGPAARMGLPSALALFGSGDLIIGVAHDPTCDAETANAVPQAAAPVTAVHACLDRVRPPGRDRSASLSRPPPLQPAPTQRDPADTPG